MTMFCSAWMVVTISRRRSEVEVCLLGDDAAVEKADQPAFPDGQHPLQGQLAFHTAVRGLIVHRADLPGVVEVGGGRPPVHNDGVQRDRVQDAPASDIPGFRFATGGCEVQPGEVGLAGGHVQLAEPVELRLEALEGDFLLFVRVLLHLHVHAHAGFRAGERFHFPDFPGDRVAGCLEMKELRLRGRMIRQSFQVRFSFHIFSCSRRDIKKPLPI